MLSRPKPSESGARPVQTMHASTSKPSTSSFVFASIISMRTGFSPGIPGTTFDAKTFVR